MYLVQKQNPRPPVDRTRFDYLSNIFLSGRNSRELVEFGIDRIGVDPGERCLARSGRSPQHERKHMPLLDRQPQRLVRPDKMSLPDVPVKADRPDLISKWFHYR